MTIEKKGKTLIEGFIEETTVTIAKMNIKQK